MTAVSPARPYRGRFAPSPTGPLHFGSLVAAVGSYLDALAHGGEWLVRIEDVDTPRNVPGADADILRTLENFGFEWQGEVLYQSTRGEAYAAALDQLTAAGLAYGCACSRKEIAQVLATQGQGQQRHGELVYPGTCRPENGGLHGREARAWRLHIAACLQRDGLPADALTHWQDRRLGPQSQRVAEAVGDFVLRRADGLWAYQLAVVVDDAAQGITDVVRGEDLTDNTARQIVLQRALGLPTPRYLHTPLVLGANGEKLSKQNAAEPLPEGGAAQCVANLQAAAVALGLPAVSAASPEAALRQWILPWKMQFG